MNNIKFWLIQNDEELGKKLIEIMTNIVETGRSSKEHVDQAILNYAQNWLQNDGFSLPYFSYGNSEFELQVYDVNISTDALGNITIARDRD